MAEIKLILTFIMVLVTGKNYEDPLRIKGARVVITDRSS